MIICHCMGTTDAAIAALAREGVDTVDEISRRTGAGLCCSPCRDEIAELLVVHGSRHSGRRRAA